MVLGEISVIIGPALSVDIVKMMIYVTTLMAIVLMGATMDGQLTAVMLSLRVSYTHGMLLFLK